MKTVLIIFTMILAFSLADAEKHQLFAADGSMASKDTLQTASPKSERFTGTVEIYITDWCGYCRQAQIYLKSRGIPFVAYDIEKDSAARQRHKELGGRGIPLIIIGPNKMFGFSQAKLEYYLNNSR